MRDTVPKEFDFLREARLMRVIAGRLRHARLPGVIIPEPLMALSSPQLLVMQRMKGTAVALSCHPAVAGLMAKCYNTRMHLVQYAFGTIAPHRAEHALWGTLPFCVEAQNVVL